jgi:hypothetical protein
MSPRKLDKKNENNSKKYIFAAAVTLFGAVFAAIKLRKEPGNMNSVPTVGHPSRH